MLDHSPTLPPGLCIRPATTGDLDRIVELREQSIARLLLPGLRPAQQTTMLDHTPVDPDLVHDGTYYVALVSGALAACGGWSRRSVLIRMGPRQESGDDFLDPAKDAAPIRAMYTHPEFARLGLASIVLAASETAARLAGFRRVRLIATAPGRLLYKARGWTDSARLLLGEDTKSSVEVTLMEKAF